MFRHCFKVKCPVSGAKMRIQYMNVARFITLLHVHIVAVQNLNIRGVSLKKLMLFRVGK